MKIEIQGSYFRSFLWGFVLFFLAAGTIVIISSYSDSGSIEVFYALGVAFLVGTIAGSFIAVFTTMRRIEFDDEEISIRCFFPGSGVYSWNDLEGYSDGTIYGGVFLLKFRGKQAYQINPKAFDRKKWKYFENLLTKGFPDRVRKRWIGPIPVETRAIKRAVSEQDDADNPVNPPENPENHTND